MDLSSQYKEEVEKHHSTFEKSKNNSNKQGVITILLVFGLFGIWAVFAPIETTIVAGGKIISKTYNKSVKHTHGGMVREIFVQEGDLVQEGQALLRLDSSDEETKLQSYIVKHDNSVLAICRLDAEILRKKTLNCETSKTKLIDPSNYEELMDEKRMLFNSNIRSIEAKSELITSRNKVLLSQNRGLQQQIVSNTQLLVSYERELAKWNKLVAEGAADELKAINTQRRVVEAQLQLDSLSSRILENNATIEAQNHEMTLGEEQFKNQALNKRNEYIVDNKLTYQNILAFEERVENLTIKASSSGHITDLKIRSAGEVVSPQKQIMAIVPNAQELFIEAFVQPTDIEKLYMGQESEISFPAFVDPSARPIKGKITYISADTLVPEGMQESFYAIRMEFTEDGLKAIEANHFKIVPGMPTSAFIHTGKRTLSAYLLNPIIQMFKGIYHAN